MSVSKTTNGGVSWVRYALDTTGFTFALAVDRSNSDIVYAGGVPGLYKTTNAGAVWSDVSGSITDTIFDLAIDPSNTAIVYAATPAGVFKTTNSGTNWFNTGCSGINALVVDPDTPSVIYAGTNTGVYKSTSGGGGWIRMNEGLLDSVITSLDINPGNYLYCGTANNGMYRWELLVGVNEQPVTRDCKIDYLINSNPAKQHLEIKYELDQRSFVQLAIYDLTGRMVSSLVSQTKEPGQYRVLWNGKDRRGISVPTGVYFSILNTNETSLVKKFIFVQ